MPSRHRTRNLIPGSPRREYYLAVTEAPHYTQYLRVSGEETFASLKPECQSGVRTHRFLTFQAAALTIAPGPPPTWE